MLQNLLEKYRERTGARRDLTRAKTRLQNLKGRKQRSQVVAPEISERLALEEGGWLRATGRGRWHLSLDGPQGFLEAQPLSQRWGLGVGRRFLPAAPEPCVKLRAAALPGERPSRALCPAPLRSGAHRSWPSPHRGCGKEKRSGRHNRRRGSGEDPRETGPPPRTHRASRPPARPSSPSSFPVAATAPGQLHWALGPGWVKCREGRGRARAWEGSRVDPQAGGTPGTNRSRGAGAGWADRGGERGCRLR